MHSKDLARQRFAVFLNYKVSLPLRQQEFSDHLNNICIF